MSTTNELLRESLTEYHEGIASQDEELTIDSLGDLIALTCPDEPRTGEQAILSLEQAERFLATEDEFGLTVARAPKSLDLFTDWDDIKSRIEEFTSGL